ncbi:hypothetical protein ASPFODRAFT_54463, partial [Aspergillus luchuensis CBS 106.47]
PLIPSKPRPGLSRAGMSILRNALPSPGLVVLTFVVIGTCRAFNQRNARGGC